MEGLPTGGKVFGNLTCVSTFASVTIPEFTAQNGFIYCFIYDGNSVTLTGAQPFEFNTSISDGINWQSDTDGTLTVYNESPYDVVLFRGGVISADNIIGGVRAGSALTRDLPGYGSYYVEIQGIRRSIYNENKSNLANAKVEYSGVAVIKQGDRFTMYIRAQCFGEYRFKVINNSYYGIYLRLNWNEDSIRFVPSGSAISVYTPNSSLTYLSFFLVAFDTINKQIITYRVPDDVFIVDVEPQPENGTVNTYSIRIPYSIINDFYRSLMILHHRAVITVENNTPREVCFGYYDNGYNRLNALSHYVSMSSYTRDSFEIQTTDDTGQMFSFFLWPYPGYDPHIPVKDVNGNNPVITPGYKYAVTLNFTGTDLDQVDSYSAVITEGTELEL
jgi:hypothetical protein